MHRLVDGRPHHTSGVSTDTNFNEQLPQLPPPAERLDRLRPVPQMNETTDKSWRVNRRQFLKFAAFTGAGITLGKYLRDYALKHEVFRQRWGEDRASKPSRFPSADSAPPAAACACA